MTKSRIGMKNWFQVIVRNLAVGVPVFVFLLVLMPLAGSEAVASDNKKISRITDLLADRDGDGRLDRLGQQVSVRGRATVGTKVFSDRYLLLYIQDGTAGIMVFSDTLDVAVSPGDRLKVSGTLAVHASKPEIVVEDLEVVQSEPRAPEGQPLSEAFKDPERHRGLLVSGEAVIQGRSPSENTKMLRIAPTNGAADSLHIFVSRANIHYQDFNFDALEAGDRIHIRGILIRYTSDYTGQTFYQVLPRRPDDLTVGNLQPMVDEQSFLYAAMDTTSGTMYLLLQDGLWGYDLADRSWRFLDALEDVEEPLSTYEFGYNAQAEAIQLWSRGIGKLLSVDPQTFQVEREDQASEHRNQFGHFPFYRDSTLYAFGGYGYWDYHHMIVHFNRSRDDWGIQTVKPGSPYPDRRVPATGLYDRRQDRLYIFGGRGTESGHPKDQRSGSREFRDVWSFSFDSQTWEKMMTLEPSEEGSGGMNDPSAIGKINKKSSSLYLPDEQLWLIPTFGPKPLFDSFYFRAIDLSSHQGAGRLSPDFNRSHAFLPTHYFYHPDTEEAVFVGIDHLAHATAYPVRVHRMSADSLVAGISASPFDGSATLYYYLMGLAVIGGLLYWYYQVRAKGGPATEEQAEEPEAQAEPITHDLLQQAGWFSDQEKVLLAYLQEQGRFTDSQEIEELLWSDIESYDYRRRLRNDILKSINKKFKEHYPGRGNLIIRKKDPSDNRRYLYGLNTQLLEE